MPQPLVILGTGGSAYDLLDIVEAINVAQPTWDVAGFLDDGRVAGTSHLGFPVLGGLSDACRLPNDYLFINVIGSDKSFRHRPAIFASTGLSPDRLATLIHPLASVSSRAGIGRGVYVACGGSVGGGVHVGNNVSISPGAIIGHDSVVEDFAMMAPGSIASGFCQIGKAAYLGAGALLRQRVRVGDAALVGMGAVVLQDVEPGSVVVGNPARVLQSGHALEHQAIDRLVAR